MCIILFLKCASFCVVEILLWDVVCVDHFPFYLSRMWVRDGGNGIFVRVDSFIPEMLK